MTNEIKNAVLETRIQIARFVNLYNKLEKMPFDVGNGDLLFPSEMNTLEAIGKNAGNTVTELCRAFGVTKGAVSQVINKLHSKGYIKKERNEAYYKEVYLSLTPKGKAVYDRHEIFHQAMDKELEDNLSRILFEDISEFQKIISLLTKHVEKYIDLKAKKL